MISVIIPALNEQDNIGPCIDNISRQAGKYEVIVADGGSSDATVTVSEAKKARVLRSPEKNIGYQNNLGAGSAKGDILLFLHADTRLPDKAFEKIEEFFNKNRDAAGGSFNMVVRGDRFFYKVISIGGNAFCKITGIHFGDRGVFVKKEIFDQINGYNIMPIMEDVDFSKRMKKKGKTKILKGPVVSSSRKFGREPFWRTLYLILWSLLAYTAGWDLDRIKKKYYGQG